MIELPTFKLKPKKEMPLMAGHPWVFSNAIAREEKASAGAMVKIVSADGKFLGIGMYNPNTSIRVRIISKRSDEKFDKAFFVNRFLKLDEKKKKYLPKGTTGYRLVHAEGDMLPGLILDRYEDVFVFQIHTYGMDLLRAEIIEALKEAFKPKAIVERSDVDVRKQEGLKVLTTQIHFGKVKDLVAFKEAGINFLADVLNGQKTGFFLDQRDARGKVGELSKGKRILNLFSYTGAFSVYAATNGAKYVTTVDVSKPALEIAKKNFKENKLKFEDETKYQFVCADVFDFLQSGKIKCEDYDLIICDPPAFAKSLDQVEQAKKAYIDINRACLELLSENGILVTSSCSGRITQEDFKGVLKFSAGRAGKNLRVLFALSQAFDHTERICFPEGRYLKTLGLEVL